MEDCPCIDDCGGLRRLKVDGAALRAGKASERVGETCVDIILRLLYQDICT